jgi:hypothetical protein
MLNNSNLFKSIFNYLYPKEIVNLRFVCKQFKNIIDNIPSIWREICNEKFCSEYENFRYI